MSRFVKVCVGFLFLAVCCLPARFALAAEAEHGVHVGMDEETSTELLDWKTDLAIYTFIVFLGLMFLLWKFAFGPISKALHDREEGIRKNIEETKAELAKAEELRGKYEGMLEAAEDKVREIYAEANAKAEEMQARRKAEADQDAESRVQHALREIERAKDQAITELFEKENQRIVQAAEHILGRALSDEDQHRLVDEALASFSDGQAG